MGYSKVDNLVHGDAMPYTPDLSVPLVRPKPLEVGFDELLRETYYMGYVLNVQAQYERDAQKAMNMPKGADIYPLRSGETAEQIREIDKVLAIGHYFDDPLIIAAAKRLTAICQVKDHLPELYAEHFDALTAGKGTAEQRDLFNHTMQSVLYGRAREELFPGILANGEKAKPRTGQLPGVRAMERKALEATLVSQLTALSGGEMGPQAAAIRIMQAEEGFMGALLARAGVQSQRGG